MSTPAAAAARPSVPESVLKKREAVRRRSANRAAARVKAQAVRKAKRKVQFKRAQSYVHEYRAKERELISLRRMARRAGNFYREPEAKVALVVRIRGIMQMPPKPKKILRLLRLRQVHSAVFVRINASSLQMLHLVEPWITWGYPNLKTTKELIYKRGYGMVNGQRKPLVDNALIEQELGKHGIICVEDLIHEIVTCGEHFREANRFLWPFRLSSPLGGYKKKTRHFVDGGDAGNREHAINAFVQRMNGN